MRTLLLIACCAAISAAETVICVENRLLEVAGRSTVPEGLFGVHGVPLTTELVADWGLSANRIIQHGPKGDPVAIGRSAQAPAGIGTVVECFFDRFQPALTLTNPKDWQARLTQIGTRYGTATRGDGQNHVIEFWNEPYLNWSVKPGVNLDPWWYDTADAVEGGPVRIKGASEPVAHLRWQRSRWFEALDKTGDRTPLYVGLGLIGSVWRGFEAAPIGDEFVLFGGKRKVRVIETLVPRDTSQDRPGGRVWFSALANAGHYADMYEVLAKAVKAADPAVTVLAGWGFNFFQSDWAGWELTYQPVLDRCHALVDGLHEHHYGIDPDLIAAGYETAAAITRLRYGRALPSWNTEAGANWDAQRPDQHISANERWIRRNIPAEQAAAFGAYAYLVGDIVTQLARCPDKALGRAAHHSHETHGGDPTGFRQLKGLRGRLLAVDAGDATVPAVAALDGERVTICAVNRSLEPKTLRLRLALPVQAGERQTLTTEGGLALAAASGVTSDDAVLLPPLQAVTWRFSLAGAAPTALRRIRQFHAPATLASVTAEGIAARVPLDAAALAAADRARLTCVVAGPADGVVSARIGTHVLRLPCGERIQRLELPLAALSGETPVTFSGTAGRLWMASIDLIEDR
jgi:hypothetical protein